MKCSSLLFVMNIVQSLTNTSALSGAKRPTKAFIVQHLAQCSLFLLFFHFKLRGLLSALHIKNLSMLGPKANFYVKSILIIHEVGAGFLSSYALFSGFQLLNYLCIIKHKRIAKFAPNCFVCRTNFGQTIVAVSSELI